MLKSLKGRASARKLRLFAVACCRWIAAWIDDPRGRAAVSVAEQYADGAATEEQRAHAARGARAANARFLNRRTRPAAGDAARQEAGSAASATTITQAPLAAGRASENAVETARRAGVKGMSGQQADLLRDLFGNPFRPLTLDPAWLAWHGGVVPKLARVLYEERDPSSGHLDAARLAVLADMLEEAGCTDTELPDHLRGPGPHLRGCFAVDLLLDKA
jgi:hypothetical protein